MNSKRDPDQGLSCGVGMTVDWALKNAENAAMHDLRGAYPMACRVLADEYVKFRMLQRHLVRAAVRAYAELNEIRARDGVPYTHQGIRSSVTEEYFDSVVNDLSASVMLATGHAAHCHPALFGEELPGGYV